MGWLYRKTLDGHATPRAYLDAQFTYQRDTHNSRVLRSALIKGRTYYAALEHIIIETGAREVWALVCLVNYNPKDHEGYIFGYKDMDETMGPYESDCPEAILDLLTPTQSDNAAQWRDGCRTAARRRRDVAALRRAAKRHKLDLTPTTRAQGL